MNFASRLTSLLNGERSPLQRQVSQFELSKKVNISRQAVSSYVTGASSPTAEKLIAIADFFCVSTDYLLGRTDYINDAEKEKLGVVSDAIGTLLAGAPEEYRKPLRIMLEKTCDPSTSKDDKAVIHTWLEVSANLAGIFVIEAQRKLLTPSKEGETAVEYLDRMIIKTDSALGENASAPLRKEKKNIISQKLSDMPGKFYRFWLLQKYKTDIDTDNIRFLTKSEIDWQAEEAPDDGEHS